MKKTKLKFAAAVAALAMTFAFVTSCGNASDVVDEIVNGGGDDSGTTDTDAKDEAEEEEKAGTDESTEETTVKTKYTNSAWVKTGITAAYDGLYLSLSDLGLDENLNIKDYAYLKANVTFSGNSKTIGYVTKQGETGSYTEAPGQGIILGTGDWNPLATIKFTKDEGESPNAAQIFLPLSDEAIKIAIQNTDDSIDTITVNYLEFIKIPDAKYCCTELAASTITSNSSKGTQVVLGVLYSSNAKANNGVGTLSSEDWKSNCKDVNICSSETGISNGYEEFEFTTSDFVGYLSAYPNINFYNGGSLGYIYFK